MKYNFLKIVLLSITITGFLSCKKNNLVVDRTPIETAEGARFLINPLINTYYVRSTGNAYKIPVSVTTVSNVDRQIQFTYTSLRAASGVQYTAPATLTMKAGQVIDTLSFSGLFAGYPTGRRDTVKVKITSNDGYVKATGYSDSVTLYLTKYCDVVLSALSGTFANTKEYTSASSTAVNYGPYTTTVINLVATSATTATCTFTNLFDDGWAPINGTLDWTDPANFKVVILSQSIGKSYGGQPAFVKTSSTPASTFSSCDGSFTLRLDITNAAGTILSASTGANSGYQIVLNR